MIKKYSILFTFISFCFNAHILNAHKIYDVNYKVQNDYHLNVSINTGAISFSQVTHENIDYIRLNSEGAYNSKKIGSPELIQFNQLIEIPYNADIRIEIISTDYFEFDLDSMYPNTMIYPTQPSRSKSLNDGDNVKFVFDQLIYNSNSLFLVSVFNLFNN